MQQVPDLFRQPKDSWPFSSGQVDSLNVHLGEDDFVGSMLYRPSDSF